MMADLAPEHREQINQWLRVVLDELKAVYGFANDQQAFDQLMFQLSPEGEQVRIDAFLKGVTEHDDT